MIVYLHGFSSAANSRKAGYLKQNLKDIKVHVPDYSSHQPRIALRQIEDYILERIWQSDQRKVMLIGSSLGGYYAQYLGASLECVKRVVLINPALQAHQILEPHIGMHTNMVTGAEFEFTEQDCSDLVLYDVAERDTLAPTLVLLDKGDELIDYRYALQRYETKGRVIVYEGGSHWFDHLDEALVEIRGFYHDM